MFGKLGFDGDSLSLFQLESVLNLLQILLKLTLALTFEVEGLKQLIELILTLVIEPAVVCLSLNCCGDNSGNLFTLGIGCSVRRDTDYSIGTSVDHSCDDWLSFVSLILSLQV